MVVEAGHEPVDLAGVVVPLDAVHGLALGHQVVAGEDDPGARRHRTCSGTFGSTFCHFLATV